MASKLKNSTPPGPAARRPRRDRRKVVFAACLVTLMGLMWMRVFFKKGPTTAAAESGATQPQTSPVPVPADVAYVLLPKVPGRNDGITRDIFAAAWDALGPHAQTGPLGVVAEVENQAAIRRLAETLRLEAIGLGQKPQALINGKLLSHGDRFTIGEGRSRFECEVTAIADSSVTLACANARITLKLAPTNVK